MKVQFYFIVDCVIGPGSEIHQRGLIKHFGVYDEA